MIVLRRQHLEMKMCISMIIYTILSKSIWSQCSDFSGKSLTFFVVFTNLHIGVWILSVKNDFLLDIEQLWHVYTNNTG